MFRTRFTARSAPDRTVRTRISAPALRRVAAVIAAISLGLLTDVFALGTSASATTVPGPPSGWSTVFSDSFSGSSGSGIDSQWMYDTGAGSTFGTGEIETMTNSTSNVHQDGAGHLDITALGSGGNWTSGRVQTTSANVGAPAGGELEVTASIQQPTGGLGYWPAFWMLGPGQWPENGEIDIMEDVNALSEVSGTIHCGTDPGGPCNESNGIGSGLRACSGCQSGFHTYTMILNRTNTSAESITFYLDGASYFTVNESQVGTSTWQAAFDHNLSIILDLAMGGGYPNGVCGCTSPTGATSSGGTMSVAYVAAYSTSSGSSGGGGGGGTGASGTGPITGYQGLCLDDRSASTALYNPVQVYTCNGTAAQQWSVVQAGSLIKVFGMCLDVDAAGTADGTKVDLYTCNGTGSQVFIPESNGELYNPQSNKCLDDTAYGGSGTQLQIWDCADTANQQWKLP
ncbi:beta-glucanase/beta-glucan synthetase [Actinospica robiniae DSM 44927]|uniref:Beta-glucanase/beta-glucan synthetase n=1 Tax=Actinospica robiniae DSM 44927 TaxID=479430 RepID=W9E4C1_9ACTN|nr:beta-glucanase/beta-glucan synthetase [Actinospica robiniae DSM 44927]